MNVIIPLTASYQEPHEAFTRPVALREVRGRPVVAWVLEGLGELSADAGNVLFAALAEHEDQFGMAGVIRPMLSREPGVIVLDRPPAGDFRTETALAADREGK